MPSQIATRTVPEVIRLMTVHAKPQNLIKGATADWEVIVGLEIHAQVTSKAKLFSGASTTFGGEPNSHVSLVDAAMPGMLPVINAECVAQAVRTGLGLKARINHRSVFDRKNYFYPDLPQGYQISQYKDPIVGEGTVVTVDLTPTEQFDRRHRAAAPGAGTRASRCTTSRRAESFVDLNPLGRRADGDRVETRHALGRRGQGLRQQAAHHPALSRHLRRQHGAGFACAPTSTSPCANPATSLGTRCEIKNVNSIRFIGQAIDTEARRQIGILEDGGAIDQETRLFDPSRGETRSMRSKEEAHDYRYFPDPDLLPLEFDQAYRRRAWRSGTAGTAGRQEDPLSRTPYGSVRLTTRAVLVADKDTADFFEACVDARRRAKRDAKIVANWVNGDVAAFANAQGLPVSRTHHHTGADRPASSISSGTTPSPARSPRTCSPILIAEDRERRSPGDCRSARVEAGDGHRRDRGSRRRDHRRQRVRRSSRPA